MLKAIKRLITSGIKPHSCKLCNTCYVCHECLREKNQIRECCYDVTEEELDILHEELRNNFALIYPVRKHSFDANSIQTKNDVDDSINCCINSRDRKNFQCDICGKCCKVEFSLTRHLNAHARAGEKFKCQTCNKCFAFNSDLQIHAKMHQNVEKKSKVCMYCDKKYSERYLKIHMRRHSGKRPFKCELCSKGFTTQARLNIHYKSHTSKRTDKVTFTNECIKVESSEDECDSFNEQSFTLQNFESEKSNSEMSDNKDFILNLSDHFNLEDDFDDDEEVSKNNLQLSLDKDLDMETPFEADDNVITSYKSPLVIKLIPG